MESEIKKAAIIHPGAIGDCLLLLPLAKFLKEKLGMTSVELVAHTDYVRFYPGRTCIDHVRSIESLPLHRLFTQPDAFTVDEKDPLITAFSGYEHVISFLGADNEHFEQNLLFVIHCSHSGDVMMMPMAGPEEEHVGQFYVRHFIEQNHLEIPLQGNLTNFWISALPQDMAMGSDILSQHGISERHSVCLIHPGGGAVAKCPPVDHFVAFAQTARKNSMEPIFVLGPAEKERLSTEDKNKLKATAGLLSDLSFENIVGVLSCTDCFLGNDSGVSHLAGAMGKKTIVLFGPTNPLQYQPLGPNVYIIQTNDANLANSTTETCKWVENSITDIFNGTAAQKHLTRPDKTV